MKRCKNITGWTDYPMEELGDTAGKIATVRRINVIGFDGNKYACVMTTCGHIEHIKAGYIYGKQGRCGRVKTISFRKLERGIYP